MSKGIRPEHGPHPETAEEWDARYAESDRMWSGDPNPLLVTETADLPGGRVLDVGCGEGADAVWLASRGWTVTAVDISNVAVERARRHAANAGVRVDWVVADLARFAVEAGPFDLVSAFYPVLRDAEELDRVLRLVAPGGTLLFVHHEEPDPAPEHGHEPAELVRVGDVVSQLVAADTWRIVRHAQVERDVQEGAGAHHRVDAVVRAVRLG